MIANLFTQANAQLQGGQFEMVLATSRKILEISSKVPEAYVLQGIAQAKLGKADEARKLMRHAISLNDKNPQTWFNYARLCIDVNKPDYDDEAMGSLGKAIELQPDNITAYYNRGMLAQRMGRYAQAVEDYRKVIAIDPKAPADVWRYLGLCLKEIGKHAEAREVLLQSCMNHPNDARARMDYAALLREQGDEKAANAAYSEVAAQNPKQTLAHYNMSRTMRYTASHPHITQMESLLGGAQTGDAILLHFALGKAYEDVGDYDASFAHYEKGNALKRKGTDFNLTHIRGFFQNIVTLAEEALKLDVLPKTIPDRTPLFIVGMPRCGSTLVESMLAAHPMVSAMGEASYLRQAIEATMPYPKGLKDYSTEHAKKIYDRYHIGMRQHPFAEVMVDKMLSNFAFIPIIRLTFPYAKIIHCTRGPMDTCFSIYKHLFFASQPFAYDLREIGEYYKLYQDMMEAWHRLMPGVIHDVAYEDVVRDLPNAARGILDYAMLPWDENCLKFYEQKRSVQTASAGQVNQPLYTSAIDSWKRYERHLTPLIEALQRP